MIEIKIILFSASGMLFGYLFKGEINQFQHYHILYPTLFGAATIGIIYNKFKAFKHKTFVKAKFDIYKQTLLIITGITVTIYTVYYWVPNFYFHWMFLLFGTGLVLSNVFYESTIQLYTKNGELYIQYSNSSYYNFDKIDSFDLQDGTLKIYFNETRIEVYNVKMEESNMNKLLNCLEEFRKKNV